MIFEDNYSSKTDKANFALMFLREAKKSNKINEIENIDYVFDCLDISGDLEYLERKLKENHIDY